MSFCEKGKEMMVGGSYDVANLEGRVQSDCGMLQRPVKCYGQQFQYSVFECIVDPAQWTLLRKKADGCD
ncbi:CRISPR-associated endonuclease Cas2 [Syntrophus sp. (in: bacteria)]|uniref:CRISPR-associated endonuclease Cas2 n=1 Tax=Syntrophus sp. (in: bacteria) TaxID=48412 RepID=UPI00345E6DC3